jgi:hypothetical protein
VSKRLYLLGTSHKYQYGVGAQRGRIPPCTAAEEVTFSEFLRGAALQHRVSCIAEELNAQNLSEARKPKSTVQVVAENLDLPHVFCEPDRRERAALGIVGENEIRILALIDNRPEEYVTSALAEQFRKRESAWLQHVQKLGAWPVLFVCGADHVGSFPKLLAEAGLSCELLHPNWRV